MFHLRPKISPLIDDDKDVPIAHSPPVAVLPVPVTVPVRVPVGVIPIGIGVDRCAIVRLDGLRLLLDCSEGTTSIQMTN